MPFPLSVLPLLPPYPGGFSIAFQPFSCFGALVFSLASPTLGYRFNLSVCLFPPEVGLK